jgi:hypothetical protein
MELKYCKDCKYFENATRQSLEKCLYPGTQPDLVNGGWTKPYEYCSVNRGSSTQCGLHAHWFVPREQVDGSA